QHVVVAAEGQPDLLYVDLHLVHEVTSPQAFESLRLADRRVRRPDLTVATMDHDVPTRGGRPAADEIAERQMSALEENCRREGIALFGMGSSRQGIVHVIGPELGLTQPGLLIVCGDSHTSTHGAFGALAFGIWTSEVEHVLATQCLRQRRPKVMAVTVDGEMPLDAEGVIDAAQLAPDVALGTSPGEPVPVTSRVPSPRTQTDERALRYMALEPGTAIESIPIDRVFIGSCTNARLEDLRIAASVVRGHIVHPKVRAMAVPGSASVKREAESEGQDAVVGGA